jgi:hypothetical protein
VFLAVNASLSWLTNVVSVYLVQISLLLIGQQGLADFFRYGPLLLISWRIVQISRQRRRKTTNTAPVFLSARQAASYTVKKIYRIPVFLPTPEENNQYSASFS